MFKKILENKKLLADIILVSVILVIGLSALLITTLNKNKGVTEVPKTDEDGNIVTDEDGNVIMVNPNTVVVYVDGRKVGGYSLSLDGVYTINGYNGGTNILVVENGEAYIREASCPKNTSDVVCVDQGKIKAVGEKITCLPNRVVVIVEGDSDEGLL